MSAEGEVYYATAFGAGPTEEEALEIAYQEVAKLRRRREIRSMLVSALISAGIFASLLGVALFFAVTL